MSERTKESSQDVAWLDFGTSTGSVLAVFDFTGDQYFSWVRSNRALVRGDRGELVNDRATYLQDFRTPMRVQFTRHDAGETGNLEGKYHKGIQAGETWWYTNPLAPAPLSDDEIAIGHCLLKMQHYVETGEPFYSLAEASQDTYLGLMIARAIETSHMGEKIRTTPQVWTQ